MVNLEAVDEMDLTTDDCGIYGSHSSPNEEVDVLLEDRGEVSDFVTLRGRTAEATGSPCPGWERVTVRRQYSWHSQTKDYKRIIIKVVHKEELLRLAIVQYQVNIPETDLIFQEPHTNRQVRIEPHVRTKPLIIEQDVLHGLQSQFKTRNPRTREEGRWAVRNFVAFRDSQRLTASLQPVQESERPCEITKHRAQQGTRGNKTFGNAARR